MDTKEVTERFNSIIEGIDTHPFRYPALTLSEGALSQQANEWDWDDPDHRVPNDVLAFTLVFALPVSFIFVTMLFTQLSWLWYLVIPFTAIFAMASILLGVLYWLDPLGARNIAVEVLELGYGGTIRLREESEKGVKILSKRLSRQLRKENGLEL